MNSGGIHLLLLNYEKSQLSEWLPQSNFEAISVCSKFISQWQNIYYIIRGKSEQILI